MEMEEEEAKILSMNDKQVAAKCNFLGDSIPPPCPNLKSS